MHKSQLKEELLVILNAELESTERAHRDTVKGATHEEAKPENDKDTRALEQTYLARGQAKRIEELREGLAAAKRLEVATFAADRPAGVGALVTAEEGDRVLRLYIAPDGGGAKLAQRAVQVVTPKSPLGEGLVGKRVGETCDVMIGGVMRELEIVGIE